MQNKFANSSLARALRGLSDRENEAIWRLRALGREMGIILPPKKADKTVVEVLVARQPIFNRQRQLYGYELLYRSQLASNEFDGTEASTATKHVISSTLLSIGLENVLCGKKAFLNFDYRLLSDEIYLSLPRQATVIEILESVEPSADLLALCRSVHEKGYTIALDDFIDGPQFEPLTHLVQLIKVDVRVTSKQEQERLLRTYQPRGIALLAEKVETYEEFEWTHAAGYDYFQGYFFARPSMLRSPRDAGSEVELHPSVERIASAGSGFQAHRSPYSRRCRAHVQALALRKLRAVRPSR